MFLTNYERFALHQENGALILEDAAITYAMHGPYSDLLIDVIEAVSTQILRCLYLSLQSMGIALYFATKLDRGMIAASLREPLFSLAATIVLVIKGIWVIVSPKSYPNKSKYNHCVAKYENDLTRYVFTKTLQVEYIINLFKDDITPKTIWHFILNQKQSLSPIAFGTGYNAPGMHIKTYNLTPKLLTKAVTNLKVIINILNELVYIVKHETTYAGTDTRLKYDLQHIRPYYHIISNLIAQLVDINTTMATYIQKRNKDTLESTNPEDRAFANKLIQMYVKIEQEIRSRLEKI